MIQILVPVAFTEKSDNALAYALTLAGKFPSRVVLLHCFSAYLSLGEYEDGIPVEAVPGSDQTALEERELKARNKLTRLCEQVRAGMTSSQRENVTIEDLFEFGYPEDMITRVSNRMSADVVVMGTSSKGETIKELLGSVTSDVIKDASSPVLAVPVNSGVDLETLSKVLFLTDFGDDDYISFHKLIRLITPFKTQIHAVHFSLRDPDKTDLRRLERFRDYCYATYRNHELIFSFLVGAEFVKALEDYLSKNQIDLIAMTRRKRNVIAKFFIPSLTRKTLFSIDIPLLVFHI
jgi:nucleotide-binding universal stress UspA family protein